MGASQWVTLLLILPLLARASEFSPHEQAARDAVSQLTWLLYCQHFITSGDERCKRPVQGHLGAW